jgi:hypothetical protein
MAISNSRLTTTGSTTVYTSIGNTAVTTLIACNTGPIISLTDETLNAASLTLYFVPNGGIIGDGTTVVKSLNIPAGETVFFSDEKVVLSNGDTIVAQASAANLITITVSTLVV